MEKSKKNTFKKQIVRNVECPKPKTVVKYQPQVVESSTGSTTTITKKTEEKTNEDKLKLEEPELYSALVLANKIHSVENAKAKNAKRSTTFQTRKHIAIDEKAAKLLNFPYYHHIYKDLIPLDVKQRPQSIPSITRAVVHKDEEPKLSDFYSPKSLPEYSFQVSQEPRITKPVQILGNSFKLYRIMENWKSTTT